MTSMTLYIKSGVLTFLSFFWVALSLFLAPNVQAAEIVQALKPAQSRVVFSLFSQLFNLSGTLSSYSGNLYLDDGDFSKSRIEVRADLSGIHLDSSPEMQLLPLDEIFRSLPSAPATFQSTKLSLVGKNLFRVEGAFVSNGKSKLVSFPMRLVSSTSDMTKIYLETKGPLKDWDRSIPLPINPQTDSGEIKAEIVFSPSAVPATNKMAR